MPSNAIPVADSPVNYNSATNTTTLEAVGNVVLKSFDSPKIVFAVASTKIFSDGGIILELDSAAAGSQATFRFGSPGDYLGIQFSRTVTGDSSPKIFFVGYDGAEVFSFQNPVEFLQSVAFAGATFNDVSTYFNCTSLFTNEIKISGNNTFEITGGRTIMTNDDPLTINTGGDELIILGSGVRLPTVSFNGMGAPVYQGAAIPDSNIGNIVAKFNDLLAYLRSRGDIAT